MSEYNFPFTSSGCSTPQPRLSRQTSNASSFRTGANEFEWACPVCKAYPLFWLFEKKCALYRKDDLRDLLRHHVILGDGKKPSMHEQINDMLPEGHSARYHPGVFQDLKDWWKSLHGWNDLTQNEKRWLHVYDKFKRSNQEPNSPMPPDPYFKNSWVQKVFVENVTEIVKKQLDLNSPLGSETDHFFTASDQEIIQSALCNNPESRDVARRVIDLLSSSAESIEPFDSHPTNLAQHEESLRHTGEATDSLPIYPSHSLTEEDLMSDLGDYTGPDAPINPDIRTAINQVNQQYPLGPNPDLFEIYNYDMNSDLFGELQGALPQNQTTPQLRVDHAPQEDGSYWDMNSSQVTEQPQYLQLTEPFSRQQNDRLYQHLEHTPSSQYLQLPPSQHSPSRQRSRSSPPRNDSLYYMF